MPAGDSMPDTYIAIMLQSLKKKEQVLDEIIRLDDQQKDTLTDPECPFDVFDETVEAKSACIDQLNQLDSGFEKLYAQVAEELDQNREDYAKEILVTIIWCVVILNELADINLFFPKTSFESIPLFHF